LPYLSYCAATNWIVGEGKARTGFLRGLARRPPARPLAAESRWSMQRRLRCRRPVLVLSSKAACCPRWEGPAAFVPCSFLAAAASAPCLGQVPAATLRLLRPVLAFRAMSSPSIRVRNASRFSSRATKRQPSPINLQSSYGCLAMARPERCCLPSFRTPRWR